MTRKSREPRERRWYGAWTWAAGMSPRSSLTCEERYELRLRRTPLLDDPIIDVTGRVAAGVTGDEGPVVPSDTVLSLDAADLGPVQ